MGTLECLNQYICIHIHMAHMICDPGKFRGCFKCTACTHVQHNIWMELVSRVQLNISSLYLECHTGAHTCTQVHVYRIFLPKWRHQNPGKTSWSCCLTSLYLRGKSTCTHPPFGSFFSIPCSSATWWDRNGLFGRESGAACLNWATFRGTFSIDRIHCWHLKRVEVIPD